MENSKRTTETSVYRTAQDKPLRGLRTVPYYLLSALLLFLIWQTALVLTAESARRFLVPTPEAVVTRLIRLIQNGALARHTGVTLLEMGLGLLVGTSVAVLLGYAVAHNRFVAYLIEPLIVTSQAVPIVALAPLLTVWFGPGLTSKVIICALIVFFPILVNLTTALKAIDPRQRDLLRLFEANRRQVLLHLEVPGALPGFLAGLKVGGTLSAMGAVVAEFVASTKGLGYLVKQGQNLYDLPMMFVAILVLVTITMTTYAALSLLERVLLRWQQAGR